MFIDTATITAAAGRGGDGSVSFHREKYIAAGGPDGGDGGRGGSIILHVDDHMGSLMDFRYKRKYTAENGAHGQGKTRSGKDGKDLTIRVPRGTLARDAETGRILADLSGGEPFVLCKGGRGGWGNKRFATATRQAPRFAKSGAEGEHREVRLEVKLLADVGLCGFPNVGKSTLLSVISAARPHVADYHFTTLAPNLGVVRLDDERSFVCADIPGLIEGAAAGAGLGHDFLRHVDRCRLLLHLVDISGREGREPCADFDAVNQELAAYSPELAARPQIVAANKCDILEDESAVDRLRAHVAPCPLFAISGATTEGVRALMDKTAEILSALPPITVYEPEALPETPDDGVKTEIMKEDGIWTVRGAWLERLMRDVNFSDYESRAYFEKRLQANGVYEQLEGLGVQEGDTVSMYGLEFDYVP